MWELILGAFAVATVAAFAAAVSGFGFSLIGVPLMTVFTGPRSAIVALTLLGTVMTLLATARERRHVDWRTASTATVTGLIGMPLGLLVLLVLSARHLSVLIAAMVLVFAVLLSRGWSIRPKRAHRVTAGVASGALLTSTGMNGPPLVIAFNAMGLSPHRFRATLQATFFSQDIAAVLGFLLVGQLTGTTLLIAAAGLPGLPLGWLIGDRVFSRMERRVFQRLVIAMLFVSALLAGGSALLGH